MEFPKSTELNKRIPKQKFYEKLSMTPALKEGFKSIKSIYWKNKLSPDTINLEPGELVKEIQIFEVQLLSPLISQLVLKQIDKQIPYHILFLFKFQDKYQVWIAYKEFYNNDNNCKVKSYYHTEWSTGENLKLKIDGFDLDTVYKNFIKQISIDEMSIQPVNKEESLEEIAQRIQKVQKLKKKKLILQNKIKHEKQLNRQIEIKEEIKKLERELLKFQNL